MAHSRPSCPHGSTPPHAEAPARSPSRWCRCLAAGCARPVRHRRWSHRTCQWAASPPTETDRAGRLAVQSELIAARHAGVSEPREVSLLLQFFAAMIVDVLRVRAEPRQTPFTLDGPVGVDRAEGTAVSRVSGPWPGKPERDDGRPESTSQRCPSRFERTRPQRSKVHVTMWRQGRSADRHPVRHVPRNC
jgi:hypothetical protein